MIKIANHLPIGATHDSLVIPKGMIFELHHQTSSILNYQNNTIMYLKPLQKVFCLAGMAVVKNQD
jgi:hypothetical protein